MTMREDFITALRQLADFLTVNPDVPVPENYSSTSIQVSVIDGDDDEKRRTVDEAALAMGVEPFDPSGDGTRWKALLNFGPIQYQVLAIDQRDMDDAHERDRLGREAFAAAKAEREANTLDGDVVEALELSQADAVHGMFGGHMEERGGHEVYIAPCGTAEPIRQTGIFSNISCGMCRKALTS